MELRRSHYVCCSFGDGADALMIVLQLAGPDQLIHPPAHAGEADALLTLDRRAFHESHSECVTL